MDAGLLLIRLALAAVFIGAGWMKFGNLGATAAFFAGLGLPSFFAYLVPATELLAGIALALGVFTDLAGILLAIVMVGAIALVKFKGGFFGGYDFDLVLLLAALGIAFAGPGKYATGKCSIHSDLGAPAA